MEIKNISNKEEQIREERDAQKDYECYVDCEGYERCSHCNEHETGMRYFDFCPRCGVKLRRKKYGT